jgi:PPOX class probable FMN-dependent enzyme
MADRITTIDELGALYGTPVEASLVKELDHVAPEYARLIEASPFVVIATSGPEGLDCSPRGDAPGFVRLADEKTLLLPDRRGNNRIDSLKNIVHDPRVALLFLIPGVGETLRVNGRAAILTAPDVLASFVVDGKTPRTVLAVTVESVYFQCRKALARSDLWNSDKHVDRKTLPSAGQILQRLSQDRIDGEAYEQAYPERMKATMY